MADVVWKGVYCRLLGTPSMRKANDRENGEKEEKNGEEKIIKQAVAEILPS